LGQEHGEKEGEFMKTRIKYEKAPANIAQAISEAKIIEDFLPPPDKLILKEKTQRVTINLSEKSLRFFKETAKQYRVSYQQMIKELLDKYTDHFKVKQR
jgi:predicted DNA binding CopG/RHH family protein